MGRGWVRALTAAVAVVGLVVGSAALLPGPAAAQEEERGRLTLTLSPTTGLVDGQMIEYEVVGYPPVVGTIVEIVQCDDPVPAGVTLQEILRSCRYLTGAVVSDEAQTVLSGTIPVAELNEIYPPEGGEPRVDYCADEPYDCSMVAYVRPAEEGAPIESLATVPVDITPSPLLVHGPGLGDPGRPLRVWVAGEPGAALSLAQCVRHPDARPGRERCLGGPDVVLSSTGRATTELTVAPTQEVDGRVLDCLLRPCQVTLFDTAGHVVAAVDVPGSFPSGQVTLDRSTGLADGSTVAVRVDSRGFMYVGQCLASVITGEVTPVQGCRLLQDSEVPPGVHDYQFVLRREFTPYAGGPPVACDDDPGGCVVALGRQNGGNAWYVPVDFVAGPAELSLSPAIGLLDGQQMAVELSGLAPGETYRLLRCWSQPGTPPWCDYYTADQPEVVASADGTASTTMTAIQRLEGLPVYCRDRCSVVAVVDSSGTEAASAPFAMAAGSVAASPATGLVDGQTVTVSGTDLMSSYLGPNVWIFPSGGWSVVQCDVAVLDDPTLLGVFTHCGLPPGSGPVDVPGSTVSHDVEVAAFVDLILGGTTDCTAAPGACTLALARLELDGSLSLHTTPLAFATP